MADAPDSPRHITQIVVQAHVRYADDSHVLFTTPALKSDVFDPKVLIPLVGDVGRWLVGQAARGFAPPADCNVVGMPFNVLLTDSFRHSPGDSIIACADYPGVELAMSVPVTADAAIPPDAWRQYPGEPPLQN